MKKIITFFMLCACFSTFAQRGERKTLLQKTLDKIAAKASKDLNRTQKLCVEDSTYTSYWLPSSNSWTLSSKTVYGYDWLLRMNSMIYYNKFNNTWMPSQKSFLTFNSHNDVDDQVDQIYSSNAWQNSSRNTMTYDNQYNMLSQLYEIWSIGTSQWENNNRNLNTYDAQGHWLTELYQVWTSGAWANDEQYLYTYSGNNVSTETAQTWTLSAWRNDYQDSYAYDSQGNLIGILEKKWDAGTSTWINFMKITIVDSPGSTDVVIMDWNTSSNSWVNSTHIIDAFDANYNITSEIQQQWNTSNNSWENVVRVLFTYDNQGRQTSNTNQQWQSGVWVNQYQVLLTYDSDGNMIVQASQMWQNNNWTNMQKTDNFYNCTTVGLNEQSANSAILQLYPNPASSVLNITTATAYKEVRILDISGKEVMRQGSEKEISVSDLSKGVYFIQVFGTSNKLLATEKFIKE